MKKQMRIQPLFCQENHSPATIRYLISDQYAELVALAQDGLHTGGRGASTIMDGGQVGYLVADELYVFQGMTSRVIQEVVKSYNPEHELVLCMLIADYAPHCFVLQHHASAPLQSAHHILPGQPPFIPSVYQLGLRFCALSHVRSVP